jgi:uncharacterized protein DUF4402
MNLKKIALCMLLASLITAFNPVKSAHAVSLSVDADVQQVLTVTAVTPLSFGSFATTAAAGTVTYNAGGTITGSGSVTLLGSEVGGVVSLNAPAVGTAVVTTVATNLAGPGTAMPLVANCLGTGGTLGVNNGDCSFTTVIGVQNIDVGGVLTINPNQLAGNYTGTITVTANFQ